MPLGNAMLKSLFGLLFRRRGTDSPSAESSPMKRWSNEELAAQKASLEANDPTAPITKEDAYRVTDHLVQRYLPADDERTEAQWQDARTRLHARVDKAFREHQANPDAKPAWQAENEAQEALDSQLRAPYRMSLDEFTARMLPALCRFPFMPALSQILPDDATYLWRATLPVTDASTWPEKYEAREARDALVGRYHPTVLEVCRMLRGNYELLRKANVAGFTEVRAVSMCNRACVPQLDGEDISIADALAAFDGSATAPLLPSPQCACARLERPSVCPVILSPLGPLREGDDPEFAAWLKDHLRSRRA